MDPATLAALERIVKSAVSEATDGMISLTVAMTVGGVISSALVSAIGALFLWVRSLTKEFADEIKGFSSKIEQLAKDREDREDQRDKLCKGELDSQRERFEAMIERKEAARKAAVDMHEAHREECQRWTRDSAVEFSGVLKQASEVMDAYIKLMEDRS